jgi:uncharacterized protein
MSSTGTGRTVRTTVVSGPTSGGTTADWELFFARRALAKLKSRLGRERLRELLKPDTDETSEQITQWLAQSDGKWRPSVTELSISGLSAAEFVAYFVSVRDQEPKMLVAQPEHFVIAAAGEDLLEVIENIGPYISRFWTRFTGDEEAVDDLLPDYPIRIVGHYLSADGRVEGHVLHQFRETDEGFDAHLAIYYPGAVTEEVLEGHRQHLAVEFTNWIAAAAQSLGRATDFAVPLIEPGE